MRSYDCATPADTRSLGARLAARLFPGALLLLRGDLGAGKTCFTQGIAAALGIEGPVQSPTFILIAEYPDARIPLFHVDLYRLKREEELWGLGMEQRAGEGIWVVEWAELFPNFWPEEHLEVQLEETEEGRRITLVGTGEKYRELEDV